MLWAVLRVASMFRQSRTHAFIRSTVTSAAIATDVQTRTFLLICIKGFLQTYQLQQLLLLSSIQKTNVIENEFQLCTEIRTYSVSITRFISVASSAACRKRTDPITFSSRALESSIFGPPPQPKQCENRCFRLQFFRLSIN